jgi:mono/diheme cytochrome c family protein
MKSRNPVEPKQWSLRVGGSALGAAGFALTRSEVHSRQSPAFGVWVTSSAMTKTILCLAVSTTVIAAAFSQTPNRTESAGARAPSGKQVYEQHCAACHGIDGNGNGPATVWLFPKPRNFNSGLFKVQSTPAGSLPTDEDLFQTITRGMPGSSMPSFSYLSERDRRDVVQYVKELTATVGADGKRVNRFEQARANGGLKPSIQVPPEPGVTIEALTKGKDVYARLQCAACHGEHGVGDGPSAPTLKDNFGLPLPPRDFTIGPCCRSMIRSSSRTNGGRWCITSSPCGARTRRCMTSSSPRTPTSSSSE